MFEFKFDIGINPAGRPIIEPVDESNKLMNTVEFKFMALEFSRTIVTSTIRMHESDIEKHPLSEDELNRLKFMEHELIRISDLFALTIKDQFELLGIADKLLNKNFDISVLTIQERDDLNYNGIIFNDSVYVRKPGLKVKVLQTGQVFELVDGVDNQHWREV